jgi:hypothetical protein
MKNGKFTGGVCYSMTKSLTLFGDESDVDTRAYHGTICVTGFTHEHGARCSNRPPVRACLLGGGYGST